MTLELISGSSLHRPAAVVYIPEHTVFELLASEGRVKLSGWPSDATLVSAKHIPETRCFAFTVMSETFPIAAVGDYTPVYSIRYVKEDSNANQ